MEAGLALVLTQARVLMPLLAVRVVEGTDKTFPLLYPTSALEVLVTHL